MSGRKKARPSFNDYPAGRQPRASVVEQQEQYNSTEITEDEPSQPDEEELERRRKRKRLAMILVVLCVLIIVIILIVVIVSVMGTSENSEGDTTIDPECVISNETSPVSYKEFECDMLATLTTEDSTFLRTYTSDTPHGKTIGWMTNEDRTDFSTTPTDQILERYVMALIYFSTEGNDWYSKFGFLSDKHVCNWNLDSSDIVRCADIFAPKKITDIALRQNGMIGKLPTEIGYLSQLTRLYISRNQLSGKIPKAIGSLTGLEKLYLSTNSFTGKIPTEMNQLTLLETLHLESNDVTGNLDGLCDIVNATGRAYQFQADCTSKRISCSCCDTCL